MSKFKDVFVIDDDKVFHFIIKKLFSKNNIDISPTFYLNGLEAIEKIKEKIESGTTMPDLILLDINMPIMDGWEFMEEIKSIKSKIRKQIIIYIVSSSIALEDRNKSKTFSDIIGYIPKPISVDDLISIVAKE